MSGMGGTSCHTQSGRDCVGVEYFSNHLYSQTVGAVTNHYVLNSVSIGTFG